MTFDEAVNLARTLATECGETLGEPGLHRAERADPNAHHWAIWFTIDDGPPGWLWLFNVNDFGEPQIMIAHNPRFCSSTDNSN